MSTHESDRGDACPSIEPSTVVDLVEAPILATRHLRVAPVVVAADVEVGIDPTIAANLVLTERLSSSTNT